MLNPLPILFLAPIAHALTRIVLGLVLIHLGSRALDRRPKTALTVLFGTLEIGLGSLLALGLLTQFAAIGTLIFLALTQLPALRERATVPPFPALLMGAMATSLIFTGGGAFALDLPI